MKMKVNYNACLAGMAALIVFCATLRVSAQQSSDQSTGNGIVNNGIGGGTSANYEADLYTGRFTSKVPIKVPPGRQGAQPKLTLSYNSALGTGWCGMGWDLNVGYIEREVRKGVPIKWANVSSNIIGNTYQYDDSLGFVAKIGGNSSRLILISGANQNPQVYRQEVDTAFMTYNYYTNNYWVVVDKSGNQFFFGEGITNQMENNKQNWTQGAGSSTFRWALDRVLDANGNATFMQYLTDRGFLYLTNISYDASINSPALAATHSISFILGSRADTNTSFISGYRVTMAKRLSEIRETVSGSNVRKYTLNYQQSPSTTRSLLSSVTEYGADFTTALPSTTFNYQGNSFSFAPPTSWPGVYNQGGNVNDLNWTSLEWSDGSTADTYLSIADLDGDGLPDRIQTSYSTPIVDYFALRNKVNGYAGLGGTNFMVGPVQNTGNNNDNWDCLTGMTISDFVCNADLFDINGDGYPDRVIRNVNAPFTNYVVQLNSGVISTNMFGTRVIWTNVDDFESSPNDYHWRSIRHSDSSGKFSVTDIMDMNGDGLPDRISMKVNAPYDTYKIQFNTGAGYRPAALWTNIDSQGNGSADWNSLASPNGTGGYKTIMVDINGDGLPDRLMVQASGTVTNYVVQLNNGAGFEPDEFWGPVLFGSQPNNVYWNSPISTDSGSAGSAYNTMIYDINGDGLPDRVMRNNVASTNWNVQLNTGSGFSTVTNWIGVNNLGKGGDTTYSDISAHSAGRTYVDFYDINGDGLPDRVLQTTNHSPYTNIIVELNQGPFPDLLCSVSNGIGGGASVSYVASTTLDNRDRDWVNDPWSEGTKCLLPMNQWVVSKVVVNNGMGDLLTNSFAFKGGYFNMDRKEFRGFSQVTATDGLGTKTTTYFHQSGGRDNSSLGEYLDQNTVSKHGMPYRVDVVGSDGLTNQITLNKVVEAVLNTNGWYFPYVSQVLTINYEGLSSGRAKATQFGYDTNTGNLLTEVNLGEVGSVVFDGQSFTDVGTDSVYKWLAYTSFGNILDHPSDVKITSDAVGLNVLRESTMSYDARGNLTTNMDWLDTAGGFITTGTFAYDQYGNQTQSTDAAGITTSATYDSTYKQLPVTETVGTFTSSFLTDIRSGKILSGTDAKGLVSSNAYDVFYRPIASYISTNSYGPASLWQSRTYYSLGGISNGISYNFVHSQVNDAVDAVNGFETYSYSDGLARTVETRTEAETGQFRVQNTVFDFRGKPCFQTLSYFSSGSGFTVPSGTLLGLLAEYDGIGRAFKSTPSVQGTFNASGQLTGTSATGGDTGSPVGPSMSAFFDGSNPWATVVTDSLGKSKKSFGDAYGRTVMVTDVTSNGNFNITYAYDQLGNLTNIVDSAGNATKLFYDSLGRKISMLDPDMGLWNYTYDNAGRLIQQVDANTNKLVFSFSDPLGRMVSKKIYNSANTLVGTVTYIYDTSDDSNYTVYPGQLYKVTDLQGCERSSYDVRGRVLKNARQLKINSLEYVTQSTYDDADRVQQLTYPGNSAIIKYSYDTAGHLIQVKSLAGTGTQEIFYTAQSFNALNQLTGYTNGNGVATAYAYFANSLRLQNQSAAFHGTNYQNLSYTYDKVSDVAGIVDGVNTTGSASASLANVTYDDLYRVVSLNSTARGTKTYTYNAIGNIVTNSDSGSGAYVYGAKPHAVISANGVSYGYDAAGNMTTRGSQTLTYDSENQLVQVSSTNGTVAFGYDDSGERLWRAGTNGYSVWIGGIYEINNGKVLCHVVAGGQLICTFEPQCGGLWSTAFGEKNWYVASTTAESILAWPFQNGRGFWTIFGGTWVGIIGFCLVVGRGVVLKRYEIRKAMRPQFIWRRAVALVIISTVLAGSIGNADAAVNYGPVFYYYHADHLGSSSLMTDRSGYLVQHYEYGTFGQTTYQNNTSAFPVSNRYTGQIADDETGLYYFGARYYDPQLGRFIQPDPTIPDPEDSQSLNRYSYCRNNPLNETDPSGLDDVGDEGSGDYGFGGDDFAGVSDGYALSGGADSMEFSTSREAHMSAISSVSTPIQDEPDLGPYFGREGSDKIGIYDDDGTSISLICYGETSSTSGQYVELSASTGNYSAHTPTSSSESGGGWLNGIKTGLDIFSMAPGPIGSLSNALSAGISLAQGHYQEAAIAGTGILLSAVGLGVLAKAYKVAREAQAAKKAEALAVDAAKARDALGAVPGKKAATYTAGVNDSKIAVGKSSNPVGCAEDDVARQLGSDTKFTKAYGWRRNPATNKKEWTEIPVCTKCQAKYTRDQFPAGTKFDPDGPWSQ